MDFVIKLLHFTADNGLQTDRQDPIVQPDQSLERSDTGTNTTIEQVHVSTYTNTCDLITSNTSKSNSATNTDDDALVEKFSHILDSENFEVLRERITNFNDTYFRCSQQGAVWHPEKPSTTSTETFTEAPTLAHSFVQTCGAITAVTNESSNQCEIIGSTETTHVQVSNQESQTDGEASDLNLVTSLKAERDHFEQAARQQHNEAVRLYGEVEKWSSEVERLRNHLMQMENDYTTAALASETREKELRDKLSLTSDSGSALESAVKERNELYEQVRNIQQENKRMSKQLQALQQALDTLQNDADSQFKIEKNRMHKEMSQVRLELEQAKQQLKESTIKLEKMSSCQQKLAASEQDVARLKCERKLDVFVT